MAPRRGRRAAGRSEAGSRFGPQASPQDAVRRDYELALQLGTRDGWDVFLTQYPDGFYAGLAKGQLSKIAAEEARAAAVEKARQAEEDKARLASDRAKKTEQDKAAATAKAAEDARLAAEKAKQFEEAKAAAAEQRRKEAETTVAKALAERQAAEKAFADKTASEKAAAALAANQSAEKKANDGGEQKVAAIAPTSSQPPLSPQETAKLMHSELRRVGCLSAAVDGDWNAASQRSLSNFNKYAGTKFDSKLASFDALDAIKGKPGRVCPLVCDRGSRADGDTCVKIACRVGYRVNDDNECEKMPDKKPIASRDDSRKRDADRKQAESQASEPQASGQIYCSSAGCRPVGRGCHIVKTGAAQEQFQREVCN